MGGGIEDAYDSRVRCNHCGTKLEESELLQVNNRYVCSNCNKLMFNIIILEKKVTLTLKEQLNMDHPDKKWQNEQLQKYINNGYKIIGYV